MYKTANHHYYGGIRILFPYVFVYCNGPTNVRKAGKGVSVPCRAPYLCPSRGRGVKSFVNCFVIMCNMFQKVFRDCLD